MCSFTLWGAWTQLVHVSGYTEQPVLVDPDFGVEARGVQLHRVVEMYQVCRHTLPASVHRVGMAD